MDQAEAGGPAGLRPRLPTAVIVDDQPFMALVTSDVLREVGIEAVYANSPDGALRLIDARPDVRLLLTEAELLGEPSGLTLARHISEERPDIHVVVLTGRGFAGDVPRKARVLQKPFASAELRTVVAGISLLEKSHSS